MQLFPVLLLSLANAGREPQPSPGASRYEPSLDRLNAAIPEHVKSARQDGFLRVLSLDCSESEVKFQDFWYLLESLRPDLGVFLRFPKSPFDLTTVEAGLKSHGYGSRSVGREYLVISKFPIDSAEVLPPQRENRVFGADVKINLGTQKYLRLLPMSLDKTDKQARIDETMEVLLRAASIQTLQQPFILLGSTGTQKLHEEALQKLVHHPLVKESFEAVGWEQPAFTDSFSRPMDHMFVSRGLARGVLGSYVFYSGLAPHLSIITDFDARQLGLQADPSNGGTYSWTADLFRVMMYWVPLVAIGACIILILGFILRKREKKTIAKTSTSEPRPRLDEAGWDVIQVSDKKDSLGEYCCVNGTGSGVSSVMSASSTSSHVVRIQTPPQYPPPPYTASSGAASAHDEKS